nr:E4 [human papillomavirus 31]
MFFLNLYLAVTKYPLLGLLQSYQQPTTPPHRIPKPAPWAPVKVCGGRRRLLSDQEQSQSTQTPTTPTSCCEATPWTVSTVGLSVQLHAQTKQGLSVVLQLHL